MTLVQVDVKATPAEPILHTPLMVNRENFAYSNGTAALYVVNKKTGRAVQCGVFLVQTPNITFSKLFQKANK